MQAAHKKPQEVASLRTQKEVLSHALVWGCTVIIDFDCPNPTGHPRACSQSHAVLTMEELNMMNSIAGRR